MNRGEIWVVSGPSGRKHRVAVLSTNEYNGYSDPFCVPIVRGAGDEPTAYLVPLTDLDPVSGMILVDRLGRTSRSTAVELSGILTGPTLARVEWALAELLELR